MAAKIQFVAEEPPIVAANQPEDIENSQKDLVSEKEEEPFKPLPVDESHLEKVYVGKYCFILGEHEQTDKDLR